MGEWENGRSSAGEPRIDNRQSAIDNSAMAIEAVIFDFGGVIVGGGAMGDAGPALWLEVEARFGLPAGTVWNAVYLENAAWMRLRVGEGTQDTWHAAIHEAVSKVADADSAQAILTALGDRGSVEFNDGMIPLIKSLKRGGYRVGLCSNAAPGLEDDLINHYQIYGLFNDVINSATVRLAKPDPRIFALAASRIRTPIERCFFTDDLPHNIEAARAAGMTAYQFDNAVNLRAALKDAGVRL
jgi:putative hydrolase of the HAD superfamily